MADSDLLERIGDFRDDLQGWMNAYPLTAFPEPDLKKAAALLKAGGMTLDAVSASNMRHVVGKIAPEADAIIAEAAELIESLQAEVEEAKLNGEAWERRSGADYERAEQAEAQVKSLADALRWVQSQSHIETRQGMLKVVSEALSKLEASNVR